MKNERRAGERALGRIEPLLEDLRSFGTLAERKPGVFYTGRNELMHFHELGDSMVADIFLPEGRIRLPVTTRGEQLDLLDRIWDLLENSQTSRAVGKSQRRR